MSSYDKLARVRDIISILRDLPTSGLTEGEYNAAHKFAITYLRAELSLPEVTKEQEKPVEELGHSHSMLNFTKEELDNCPWCKDLSDTGKQKMLEEKEEYNKRFPRQ